MVFIWFQNDFSLPLGCHDIRLLIVMAKNAMTVLSRYLILFFPF